MHDDPTRLDLHDLHAAYAEGRLEPVAVLQAHLARMDAFGPSLGCVIHRLDATALVQAQASAARWRAGRPLGLLDGIPVGLKDNIAVAGAPCTAGTAALSTWVPQQDATVVTRLREAGAVLVAKLNLHEAALGATSANPVYGDCQHPLRHGFTPGGSSGGSAAAVAAGLCTVALGTDTMGSVRIPAAYCGLFGYKPALGEVPLEGIVPLSTTLDSCGPLARSVRDVMVVADVLAGRATSARPSWSSRSARDVMVVANVLAGHTPRHRVDAYEAKSASSPVAWVDDLLVAMTGLGRSSPSGWRIGVPAQVAAVALEPPVAAAWQTAQQALARAGARLVPVEVPIWQPLALRRAALVLSEMEGGAWWTQRLGEGLPGLSPSLQAMLRFPQTLSGDKRERARATVQAVRDQAAQVFDEVDLLLLPTAPQPAFAHGAPVPPDQGDFTTLANAMGCAALCFPVPVPAAADDALPVGCQLLGPRRAMQGEGSERTSTQARR